MRATVGVLARLHEITPANHDLSFLAQPRHGASALDQQLGYQRWYYEWARNGVTYPLIERTLAWLDEHRPPEGDPVLNWGDARIGNVLYVDFEPAAVLDWEMATLGPPELDLGWFVFIHETALMWMPDLPGFGNRGDVIRRYELSLGREVVNLRWYEVWAGMRAAAIQAQLVRRAHVLGEVPDLSGREQTAAVASLRRLVDLP